MVERDITKRWEQGIPHHPKSIRIYKTIAKLDFEVGGDCFSFSSGGDGDNGEHLMYLLDIMHEEEDEKQKLRPIEQALISVKEMSPAEFRQSVIDAGIVDNDGKLMPHYQPRNKKRK